MKYKITHNTKYTYAHPVPVCHNLVHLQPRRRSGQSCENFRLVVQPEPNDLAHQIDAYGNHTIYFSIEQPHLGLNVTSTSDVHVQESRPPETKIAWDTLVEQLRIDRSDLYLQAYEFAFPTHRTHPFGQLTDFALSSFRPGRPLLEAATDLTHRIYSEFQYVPGATNVSTPIAEVFQSKRGVCQDFAHLQLACFRSLGLAARYVSGYLRTSPPPGKQRLVGADASHAWVSVFFGDDGWIDFDPTNDVTPSTDHITLAWGRDYHDVTPVCGVILGGGTHHMDVSVDVAPYGNQDTT